MTEMSIADHPYPGSQRVVTRKSTTCTRSPVATTAKSTTRPLAQTTSTMSQSTRRSVEENGASCSRTPNPGKRRGNCTAAQRNVRHSNCPHTRRDRARWQICDRGRSGTSTRSGDHSQTQGSRGRVARTAVPGRSRWRDRAHGGASSRRQTLAETISHHQWSTTMYQRHPQTHQLYLKPQTSTKGRRRTC